MGIKDDLEGEKDRDALIAQIRKLDRKAALAEQQRKVAEKKTEQAEAELQDAIGREEVLLASNKVRPRKHKVATNAKLTSATALLCCTDWHYEETVEAETVNGLNEFNLVIAKRRIANLWKRQQGFIEAARVRSNVNDIVIWLGGDFITGTIHEELLEGNSLSPTQSLLAIQNEIIGGINYFLEDPDIRSIRVVTNHGNHGRTTPRMRIACSHKNSYEWLAYMQMQSHFAEIGESRVKFHVANSYHNLQEIEGWKFRFHHGDSLRYQGGVGGLSIPVNKSIAQWNKASHADYDIFGHWHQFFRCWHWLCVGCLMGYSPYALSIKADFQPPTQGFVLVDKRRGIVTAEPVFLE